MGNYKVSKHFNLDISLDELIKFNKTCKIDTQSKNHFETYNGVLIYLSHPNGKEKFSIQLGVTDDGFMYEGDYGCEDKFKEIPIEVGLAILDHYRKLMNVVNNLDHLYEKYDLYDNTVKDIIK